MEETTTGDSLSVMLATLSIRDGELLTNNAKLHEQIKSHQAAIPKDSTRVSVSSIASGLSGTHASLYEQIGYSKLETSDVPVQLFHEHQAPLQRGTLFEWLCQALHLCEQPSYTDERGQLQNRINTTYTDHGIRLAQCVLKLLRSQHLYLGVWQPQLWKGLDDGRILTGIPDWIGTQYLNEKKTYSPTTLELKTSETHSLPTMAHCVQACYQQDLASKVVGAKEAYICIVNIKTASVRLFRLNVPQTLQMVQESQCPCPGLPSACNESSQENPAAGHATEAENKQGTCDTGVFTQIKNALDQYQRLSGKPGGVQGVFLAGLLNVRNGEFVLTPTSQASAITTTQALFSIKGLADINQSCDLSKAYDFYRMKGKVTRAAWDRLVDSTPGKSVPLNSKTAVHKWALVHTDQETLLPLSVLP